METTFTSSPSAVMRTYQPFITWSIKLSKLNKNSPATSFHIPFAVGDSRIIVPASDTTRHFLVCQINTSSEV